MADTTPENIFPREAQQSVDGLIWLGYLTDTVEFCGHRFGIRTLTGSDELLIGLLTKQYTETFSQAKAWMWAHVALCLTSVDDQDDFCPPIGPNPEEFARARFNYVTKWYEPLGAFLFSEYERLREEQKAAVEAVRDLSSRSLRTFSPSEDSLKEPGSSTEPTDSEGQP